MENKVIPQEYGAKGVVLKIVASLLVLSGIIPGYWLREKKCKKKHK